MQGITPFLWFDDNAEEAANFYVSIFPGATLDHVARYGEAGPGEPGSAMIVSFRLRGLKFTALNGGPQFSFSSATSFMVNCDTQDEIDHLWRHLCEGGETMQCGWVRDRFGVTWQIIPTALPNFIGGDDPEGALRATKAMYGMVKLDIAELERAYNGAALNAR
jgi:predicted 3-demethylubiquinone-9 3-methyltransferase (glyoxalase superfamily)